MTREFDKSIDEALRDLKEDAYNTISERESRREDESFTEKAEQRNRDRDITDIEPDDSRQARRDSSNSGNTSESPFVALILSTVGGIVTFYIMIPTVVDLPWFVSLLGCLNFTVYFTLFLIKHA